jgi:hypothetical protein
MTSQMPLSCWCSTGSSAVTRPMITAQPPPTYAAASVNGAVPLSSSLSRPNAAISMSAEPTMEVTRLVGDAPTAELTRKYHANTATEVSTVPASSHRRLRSEPVPPMGWVSIAPITQNTPPATRALCTVPTGPAPDSVSTLWICTMSAVVKIAPAIVMARQNRRTRGRAAPPNRLTR